MSVSPFSALGIRSAHERHACDRATAVTKSLLGYLVLAGPFYVLVSLAQALTRTGFSVRRDEWSLLALGHLGWIQMANLALTGAMVIAGAVGMRRAMSRASGGRPVGVEAGRPATAPGWCSRACSGPIRPTGSLLVPRQGRRST